MAAPPNYVFCRINSLLYEFFEDTIAHVDNEIKDEELTIVDQVVAQTIGSQVSICYN